MCICCCCCCCKGGIESGTSTSIGAESSCFLEGGAIFLCLAFVAFVPFVWRKLPFVFITEKWPLLQAWDDLLCLLSCRGLCILLGSSISSFCSLWRSLGFLLPLDAYCGNCVSNTCFYLHLFLPVLARVGKPQKGKSIRATRSGCTLPSCISCLVLSCLVWSGLVWSCLVLSCLVLSCLVLSCLVLSCLVLVCCALF